ncbi:hypothetical protein POX_d06080 [Penicillium oxalicum]|uniref:Uncharacterized protein n=1 Tax=Penicillium oxalicum (strain 114-2 / CGMCC 5302) TaxID=933388 RepID=S8BAA6_PENO1|nr:hypothetical protein POX_d06080 [Penicillium oxalicum]EPS31727.1 hypothetical protein PDE_06684 [Penicillium oxalicum 114-2]KAI2790560.1 hypothetical protein POX_d06080 [Penicillium oxalicum]
MSSIIGSVKDLIASVFEVIFSVFRGAFDLFSDLITALVHTITGFFQMVLSTIGNVFEAAGGVGKFVASNIVVIALIAAGIFGYLQYQARQGRTVKVGDKKLN